LSYFSRKSASENLKTTKFTIQGEPFGVWAYRRIGVQSELSRSVCGRKNENRDPGCPRDRPLRPSRGKRQHANTPHAATPPRRHAETPKRRYAETPKRRYAETPIRRNADTPIRRNADTFPYGAVKETSLDRRLPMPALL
jgi:hypothetical protein